MRREPAGLRWAAFLAVLLAMGAPRAAQAKRRPPPEIGPVVQGDVRYVVPHFGSRHGKEQNGGYVQAFSVASGKLLWDRMVYRVIRDETLEADVQDVFISRIRVEGGALRVENDVGDAFEMDVATGSVTAVVRKSGRTEVPSPGAEQP